MQPAIFFCGHRRYTYPLRKRSAETLRKNKTPGNSKRAAKAKRHKVALSGRLPAKRKKANIKIAAGEMKNKSAAALSKKTIRPRTTEPES